MAVTGMAAGIKCPWQCEAGEQSCANNFPTQCIYSYAGIKYILEDSKEENYMCFFFSR